MKPTKKRMAINAAQTKHCTPSIGLAQRGCNAAYSLGSAFNRTIKVGVANGGTSTAKYVTKLPFRQLSAQATQADTFQDFPSSLMSVGKTADDGIVSVFTKEGVNVFKEADMLITCKGKPILIGVRDSHGRY